ncbi:MAG TPA: 16S rRNA (cytosine(967)-C(5))-methyltransferase RsmB [Clostridiales bacterium]|nr:16S rRNA (cytosine(967)-C(5))-methyltransferase RsmB [Clostridiales bacterium]
MKTTREMAADILYEVTEKGAYANLALHKSLSACPEQRDRAFVTNLVYGTLRKRTPINEQLRQFLKKPIKEKDIYLLSLLRLGFYELLYSAAKPHAVVNEIVAVGKKRGNEGWGKIINGVLRNLLRNKETLSWPDFKSEGERLAFFASIPPWIYRLWLTEKGEAITLRLLQSFDAPQTTVLRVNSLKCDRAELKTLLHQEGIITEEGSLSSDALRLKSGVDIGASPLFLDGYCTVQEESSQLASIILGPKRGQVVLDMCAAPGGKTTHLAQLMENTGTIRASDIYAHKIKLMEENAARLGVRIIEAEKKDALCWGKDAPGEFDGILLDAPCSGLGVLNRRLDSALRKGKADIAALAALQRDLLSSAHRALKNGGRLVYSTCTLSDAENKDNVAWFLKKYPDMKPVSFAAALPGFSELCAEEREQAEKGALELLPFRHETDGFFLALFEKVKA